MGLAQDAFCDDRPAKRLLLAALKPAYCTLLPEWMATRLKVLDWLSVAAGRAVTAVMAEVARKRFLNCILVVVVEW